MSFLWGKYRDNDGDESCSSDEGKIIDDDTQDDARNLVTSLAVLNSKETHSMASPQTMTWEEAHRSACIQHSSLKVTRFQMEAQFPVGKEIPGLDDDVLLVWDDTIVNQLAGLLKPSPTSQQENTSDSSSPSSFIWKTINGIWSFARSNREDDDSESEDEQEETLQTDARIGLVHSTTARSILSYLVSILKANPDAIVPLSSASWKKWVLQQEHAAEEQVLLNSLSADELKVLFQTLERTGVSVSIHTAPSSEIFMVTGTPEHASTRVVEYELQQTVVRLEQEYAALEQKSKNYQKAALDAKRRKANPIPSMRLYKLCEEQMAHKQNHLLQIETVRMALQQAVNNRSVVQVMGSARTMLRDIHKELEDVHDVMDDLKEAMQDHEEVNVALQSNVMLEMDEDELLQELQNLSLDGSVVSVESETKNEPTVVDAQTVQMYTSLVQVNNDNVTVDTDSNTDEPIASSSLVPLSG